MNEQQIAKLAQAGETPAEQVGGFMPTRQEWVKALALLRMALPQVDDRLAALIAKLVTGRE